MYTKPAPLTNQQSLFFDLESHEDSLCPLEKDASSFPIHYITKIEPSAPCMETCRVHACLDF